MANPELARMATNIPVPGQSLTRQPDSRLPVEQPPAHTEMNETVGSVFDDLMSDEKLPAVIKILKDNKGYVDRIASAYIEQGIVTGKWNVDMAHLLVEPVLFIFCWIASQSESPVTFKGQSQYDPSGLDVLSAQADEEASRSVVEQSLLEPAVGEQ